MEQITKDIIAVLACFGVILFVVSPYLGLSSFAMSSISLTSSSTIILSSFIVVLGCLFFGLKHSN